MVVKVRVRGCMANLIKKKQSVSPTLTDSFTSWRLWEKTPAEAYSPAPVTNDSVAQI